MRRFLVFTGGVLFVCASARAGERVVLTSGFEMHADRHELLGNTVRVYEGDGVSEIPTTLIAEYRAEEYTPPPPPKAAPASLELTPAKAAVPAVSDPHALIRAAVKKHNLPPSLVALVEGVAKQESGFHSSAVSPKGAIGVMQLMPGTAHQLGADPHNPEQNVDAGTRYLTELLVKYEDRDDQVIRALAAYNAGPGAVDRYNGVPPYRETRDYVRRVVRNYLSAQKAEVN